MVHGDEITAFAIDLELDWYTAELEKLFEIQVPVPDWWGHRQVRNSDRKS